MGPLRMEALAEAIANMPELLPDLNAPLPSEEEHRQEVMSLLSLCTVLAYVTLSLCTVQSMSLLSLCTVSAYVTFEPMYSSVYVCSSVGNSFGYL